MREVVVILSVMCASHVVLHGGTQLLTALCESLETDCDPRLVGLFVEGPITRNHMIKYNLAYGIPLRKPAYSYSAFSASQWSTHTQKTPWNHSQPSSLISVTSNPSDRRASPAIF